MNDPLNDVFMEALRANVWGELSTMGKVIYVRKESDGALKEMTRQRYLNIDSEGRVGFGKYRQLGFSVSYPSHQLLFKGQAGFLLCDDGLVVFKKTRGGISMGFIIYREVLAAEVFKDLQTPSVEWFYERFFE